MKLLTLLLLTTISLAKTRIAVVDTSLSKLWHNRNVICEDKVYKTSYVKSEYTVDIHADQIIDTLYTNLPKGSFCIVPIVWTSRNKNNIIGDAEKSFLEALSILKDLRVDYVNLSISSGSMLVGEYDLLKVITEKSRVYISSGNNHEMLNKQTCQKYPVCYSRILTMEVVGDLGGKYTRGSILTRVHNTKYNGTFGQARGTSLAVPRAIAEDINSGYRKR